jgi:hypothetical protein
VGCAEGELQEVVKVKVRGKSRCEVKVMEKVQSKNTKLRSWVPEGSGLPEAGCGSFVTPSSSTLRNLEQAG